MMFEDFVTDYGAHVMDNGCWIDLPFSFLLVIKKTQQELLLHLYVCMVFIPGEKVLFFLVRCFLKY